MNQAIDQQERATIPCGPLDSGKRCEAVREVLQQTLAAGSTSIVLDLQGNDEISPSGIYLLLAARHSLEERKGCLTLVNPGEKIQRLCTMLHLDALLGLSAIDDQ